MQPFYPADPAVPALHVERVLGKRNTGLGVYVKLFTMLTLLPSTPLTSLRSFAPPLPECLPRGDRACNHRRLVVAQRASCLCRTPKQHTKRDVSVAARVVAENPTAPEVKAGQQASSFDLTDMQKRHESQCQEL